MVMKPKFRKRFSRSNKSSLQRQINKIKRNLNVEKKEWNTTLTAATIVNGSGAIQQLTNIPQGDTTSSRDGSQCRVLSVQGKGIISQDPDAVQTVVRLMLVLDKQTNQAIYNTSDLLETVVNVASLIAPLNLDNKNRFIVLWDKIFSFSSNSQTVRTFKFFKKLNLLLRYDASTPSIADLTSNSLSMVRISSEASMVPQLDIITRVRFIDN